MAPFFKASEPASLAAALRTAVGNIVGRVYGGVEDQLVVDGESCIGRRSEVIEPFQSSKFGKARQAQPVTWSVIVCEIDTWGRSAVM